MNLAKQSEDLKYVTAIEPKNAVAGTINGNDVDTRGFRSASFVLGAGLASGDPVSFSIAWSLEEKEASGDAYAACVPAIAGEAVAGASDAYEQGILDVQLEDRKRYVRIVAVVTITGGTEPAIPLSCLGVLGNPFVIPVTQQA